MEKFLWKMSGADVTAAYVFADSFDEAIEKARSDDVRYNSGRVVARKGAVLFSQIADRKQSVADC